MMRLDFWTWPLPMMSAVQCKRVQRWVMALSSAKCHYSLTSGCSCHRVIYVRALLVYARLLTHTRAPYVAFRRQHVMCRSANRRHAGDHRLRQWSLQSWTSARTDRDVYAPKGLGQSLHDTLAGQMQYVYFPVRLDQMGAKIRYHELIEGDFRVGDVKVTTQYLNHTALTLGYRLEAAVAALVYSTDHEPFSRHLASGKGPIQGQDRRHCEFLAGADLVIHDAQYTLSEYADKVGWGHSTVDYAVAMCRQAKAARVALTHHDPARTDDAIEGIVNGLRADKANAAAGL